MKKFIKLLVLAGFASGLSASAADPSVVVLQTVGDVSSNLVARVGDWVAKNVQPVTNKGVLKTRKQTLEQIAQSVSRPEKGHVALILANQGQGKSQYCFSKDGVVVVNLTAMRPADLSTEAARETFARRVEKEAVGGVAVELGMKRCPFIHCALFVPESVADLDEKARGLCPPCMQKWAELKGPSGEKMEH